MFIVGAVFSREQILLFGRLFSVLIDPFAAKDRSYIFVQK